MGIRTNIILYIFMGLVGLLGCDKKAQVIPKDELVGILVELQMADALGQNQKINPMFDSIDHSTLYMSVLKHHKYTMDDLDSTLAYYAKDGKTLDAIYNKVYTRLNKKMVQLQAQHNELTGGSGSQVWNLSRSISRQGYSAKGETLNIPLDDTCTCGLKIKLSVNPTDMGKVPRFKVYYVDSAEIKSGINEKDVVWVKELLKSKYIREFDRKLLLNDSSKNMLVVKIPEYDIADTAFYKNFNIVSIQLSNLNPAKQ